MMENGPQTPNWIKSVHKMDGWTSSGTKKKKKKGTKTTTGRWKMNSDTI